MVRENDSKMLAGQAVLELLIKTYQMLFQSITQNVFGFFYMLTKIIIFKVYLEKR